MPLLVLTAPDLFLNGVEASAQATTLNVNREGSELDATTFADEGWAARRGGLTNTSVSVEGYADHAAGASSLDAALALALNSSAVFTATPEAVAEGGLAFTMNGLLNAHTPQEGDVGQLIELSFGLVSHSSPLVRGTVLSSPRTARTASGTGPAYQLGAVGAAQRLWVGIHVIASTGGTITPRIESDDASGFLSPTTRVTGAGMTAPGSQWLSLVGPVADTWYRAAWTISAGSHQLLAVVGIQ